MAGGSAWKMKPGWYLVSTEDKMIPPDAQRGMSKRAGSTVVEVKGSHAVYVSQPRALHSDTRTKRERLRREAALDETIEQSFPASDPPSTDPNPDSGTEKDSEPNQRGD